MNQRSRPVTGTQAILGTLCVAAAVGAVITLSNALIVPVDQVPPLPAVQPDASQDADQRPGAVACPTLEEVESRVDPTPVTSAELVECPELFDGRRVTFEGEAVGAVLRRGDRAWLHLNDDVYGLRLGPISSHRVASGGNSGIAVSVPIEVSQDVLVGGARRHGDALEVVGEYHRAAAFDGGGPAIWAERADIIRPSAAFEQPVSLRRVVVAAALSAVVAALAVVAVRQRV